MKWILIALGLAGALILGSNLAWDRLSDRSLEPPKKTQLQIIPSRPTHQQTKDRQLFEIHKNWLGTQWAFSGTSLVPKQGPIACGYFVTTTLRETGMEIDRVRLAQAASETMILEITDPDSVKRFSDVPLSRVITTLKNQGEGYYIIGLDNHTGFLKVDNEGDAVFIHSGPGKGVVIEKPEHSQKLVTSRYRVTGKLQWHQP